MFILKKVGEGVVEETIYLGGNYAIISQEKNEEQFKGILEQTKMKESEQVYAFLGIENNSAFIPLAKGTTNFILTTHGVAFEDLSYVDNERPKFRPDLAE